MKILSYIIFGILQTVAGFSAFVAINEALGQKVPPVTSMEEVGALLGSTDFWTVVAILGAVIGLTFAALRTNLMKLLKPRPLGMIALTLCAFIADMLIFADGSVVSAQLLFTVAASATERNNSQFTPQYIVFETATVPSRLQISVVGKAEIMNLDGEGITELNKLGKIGSEANVYLLQIADGFDGNQLTEFTIENASATPLEIFGGGIDKATQYLSSFQTTVLDGSGQRFAGFEALFIPSAGANDIINVNFDNGTQQPFTALELRALSLLEQDASGVQIGNTISSFSGATIESVNYIPVGGNRTVYQTFTKTLV